MEVGVAGSRRPNFYQYLPRPRLRHFHFTKLGRLFEFDELVCLHDCSLVFDPVVIDEYASRAAEDIAPPILRRILDEPRVLQAFSESLHREVHLQPREWTAEAGVDAGAPPEVLIIRA